MISFEQALSKLLFLAKRTRVEILLCISHLAGRVSEPTVDDKMKLERVVKFLKNNPGRKLVFRKMNKLYGLYTMIILVDQELLFY